MFWNQRIVELEARIHQKQNEVEAATSEAQVFFNHAKLNIEALPNYFGRLLSANQKELADFLKKHSPQQVLNWNDSRWKHWEIDPDSISSTSLVHSQLIRVGEWIEQRNLSEFSKPEFVPFIGGNKTIIIRCNDETRVDGLALLQSLVIRAALLLPHQIRYTFCDPANSGGAFLMRRSLP